MDNNQLLQKLCGALAITESDMRDILLLAGYVPDPAELPGLPGSAVGQDGVACSDIVLRHFLEGLILQERGPREDGTSVVIEDSPVSNNQVLKKLRIAFNLQEEDMQLIFAEGEAELSASEFGALFRKENNKHFRPCSDALLNSFLAGLTPSLDE